MKMEAHIEARMAWLVEKGWLEHLPSPWQVKVGWMAMLPVTLSESDRERESSRQTLLGQIPLRVPLQILYCPRQFIADTGLTLTPRQLVRHVLSVYHEDAFLGYDLQLLQSHSGGLELLAQEASRVVRGSTRWAPLLRRLVGEEGYHANLISLAEKAHAHQYPDTLDLDTRFVTLLGFARFCISMPDWPGPGFYGFDWEKVR